MSPDIIIRQACRYLAAGESVSDDEVLYSFVEKYIQNAQDRDKLAKLASAARERIHTIRVSGGQRLSVRRWYKFAGFTYQRRLTKSHPDRNGNYVLSVLAPHGPGLGLTLELVQPDGSRFRLHRDYGTRAVPREIDGCVTTTVSSLTELCRRSNLPNNGSLANFFGLLEG